MRLLRWLGAREGEEPLLVGLGAYFFFLIGAYTTIKPATRSLVMETVGADWIAAVVVVTALLIGGVVMVVEWLIDHTSRRHLLVGAAAVFTVCLLVFYVALWRKIAPAVVDVAFYLWADIFSIVSVTLFWSFANDLSTPDQGKRLFGLIGGAGQTGAMLGGALAGKLSHAWGTQSLLLVSAGLLLGTIPIIRALDRAAPDEDRQDDDGGAEAARREACDAASDRRPEDDGKSPANLTRGRSSAKPAGGVTQGLRLILASPYLLNILAILGLSLMASQFVEQQFNKFVEISIAGLDERTAYLGWRDVAMNVIAVTMQLFMTGPILGRLGFTFALMLMPLADLSTGLWILWMPALGASAAAKILDTCLKYGITQITKETLYLPTRREVKYKAKAFIDMFFHRIVKGVAALSIFVATFRWHVSPGSLSVPVVILCALWIGAVLAIRGQYIRELERRVRELAQAERLVVPPLGRPVSAGAPACDGGSPSGLAGATASAGAPSATRETLPKAGDAVESMGDAAIDQALSLANSRHEGIDALYDALARRTGRPEITLAVGLARRAGTARAVGREYLEQVLPARWRRPALALIGSQP